MRNQNPLERELYLLRQKTPSMRYDGSEPFEAWQKTARKKLETLLGLPKMEPAELDVSIEWTKQCDTHTEIRFTFQSEPGYYVPCVLLIPNGTAAPAPVMICLQGHSKGMHISLGQIRYEGDQDTLSGGDRDFAIRTVKEGYCALAIEQRGFGECGGNADGPQCHIPAMASLLTGRTAIGERVWDVMRAIDVLKEQFPQVDADNVFCMGNSGGGTATFYAACMDERIKIAMPSCSVCSYDVSIAPIRHCVCNFIPNIRTYFDMGDLGGLIAPRPLVMVNGAKDKIFPIDGAKETFARIQSLYAASGVPGNCSLVVGKEGHRFYADDAWPVMHRYIHSVCGK